MPTALAVFNRVDLQSVMKPDSLDASLASITAMTNTLRQDLWMDEWLLLFDAVQIRLRQYVEEHALQNQAPTGAALQWSMNLLDCTNALDQLKNELKLELARRAALSPAIAATSISTIQPESPTMPLQDLPTPPAVP